MVTVDNILKGVGILSLCETIQSVGMPGCAVTALVLAISLFVVECTNRICLLRVED